MQWCCLQSIKVNSEKFDGIVAGLNAQMDEGEAEMLALAKQTKNKENQQECGKLVAEVLEGPHEGKTWSLQPKRDKPCLVGRGRGKKLKEHGMSLPKDLEMSTTHGKFVLSDGCFYFVDMGSTNGTEIAGKALEEDVPVKLYNDIRIQCGKTLMKITLA
jgi:hypothetical protein